MSRLSKEEWRRKIEAGIRLPEMIYRPYIRWWLAEGSHSDETIRECVEEIYQAGIGGIEFVTLDESDYLSDQDFAWGSCMWNRTVRTIVRECRKRKMSVSMSGGTHWATVNLPHISPDEPEASHELGYTVCRAGTSPEDLSLRCCRLNSGVSTQKLVRVTAAAIAEEAADGQIFLDPRRMFDITDQVRWKSSDQAAAVSFKSPDDASYMIFAFYSYGTGEYFKPSVSGKNYTVNYLDQRGAQSVMDYWEKNVLTPEIQEQISEIDECDLYMDSMELATLGEDSTKQLWAEDLPEVFMKRRGYDVSPYLPFLIRTTPDGIEGMGLSLEYAYESQDHSAKGVRNDFYQTLTELYEERFLRPIRDWLHRHKMKLRAETSYGKTFEISQPIRSVDYVETESFEFGNELDLYRAMAGAAHIFGRRLSSESGAVEGSNYLKDHGFYRQMFYMQYVAGVQKTVYHGYSAPYGPPGNVKWPGYEGMMPIFSDRFQNRQPSAIDYPQFNLHLSRIQKVLETGRPRIDLAILRTDYYMNNGMFGIAAEPCENRTHHNLGYYWQDAELQNRGYTYEYFSPYLLNDPCVTQREGILCPDTAGYQAILIIQEEFPPAAAKALYEIAREGVPVIFVDHVEEIIAREGRGSIKRNGKAASVADGFLAENRELSGIMEQIRCFPNVRTAKEAAEVPEILEELNILPRVSKRSAAKDLLTVFREDGDIGYLFAYHYRYESGEAVDEVLEINGKYEVFQLNSWSGKAEAAETEENRHSTSWKVHLRPGDTALYVLVNKEKIEPVPEKAVIPASGEVGNAKVEIIELTGWQLYVDACLPGNKCLRRTYSAELDKELTEVAYDTVHERVNAGIIKELLPWKDISGLGEYISGTGTYSISTVLSERQARQKITFCCGSLNLCTASFRLNDTEVPIDMDACEADLTGLARPGENSIQVKVSGSLRNALRQEGYPYWEGSPAPAAYGMTGRTFLRIKS